MATPKNILVMHGPNLNLLGTREPAHYGSATLAAINQRLADRARAAGVALETYQSNIEGELVDRIQRAQRDGVDFIIINPAAFTHTSIAMRDALAASGNDSEVFVIGGGELYRLALPLARRIYLTTVDAEPAGDTLMPAFELSQWRELSAETFSADEKHAVGYRFSVLERI